MDVDLATDELTQKLEIKSLPTFKFFKNGKEVDMVRGADEEKLWEKMYHFEEGTWSPSMSDTF